MASKGLGKGLDSMIPPKRTARAQAQDSAANKNANKSGEVILKINDVEPNNNQPRRTFNEDSLIELSESIKQHGIVQPLVVAKQKDYYEIIAGERRWRAAKIAGLKEVPVIIKDYSPQEIMEVALIENIQREDLNPIEEAKAYKNLIDEYNLKQDQVAEKVSKSRTAVTNALRLLKLDDRVQEMLINENISSGHARALLGLDDAEKQYNIATQIFDEKLSVRETEKLVKKIQNNKDIPVEKKKVSDPAMEAIYHDLEEKMKSILGTKVAINKKDDQKGKIEIEYYSMDELDRIIDLIRTIA